MNTGVGAGTNQRVLKGDWLTTKTLKLCNTTDKEHKGETELTDIWPSAHVLGDKQRFYNLCWSLFLPFSLKCEYNIKFREIRKKFYLNERELV